MQRTKSKLLSILLSLVMLLSLVPAMGVTASAAGPDPTFVSVDGGKGFASPTKLYYKNGDTEDHFSGDGTTGDYNAHYDPNTGTLTLKDYHGGKISLGGAAADHLTIKLIGHNTVTVNGYDDVGIGANGSGSSITITADSSGSTLAIEVTSDSKAVAGIDNNFVPSATSGNVTIKGYADVTITATTNSKNKTCYGIYANNVTIEENAKVAVTVNAPSNEGGGLVYGIFAETNVTIATDGEITVDASNAGTGDRAYSTGVNSKGTLTLTKVGKMTVKWKDKDLGGPLYPGVEFDSNAYDNHVDKATCTATYKPKVATPSATVNDVSIVGTTGTAIDDTDVVITLANDTFKSPFSGDWITNLPAGLSQSVSCTDDTHAKITVTGNPSVASSAELAIKIPAANLVTSTSDLDVMSNANAKFEITATATPIAVPTPSSVTYNGTKQTGVSGGTGYTLGGDYEATDVGATNYTATATLNPGYKWDDESTGDKTITWNIGKRTPTATDFNFAAPTDLIYDGSNKTANVTLKTPLSKSGAITVKYEKGGTSVTETKDVGEYTVKIDVAGGDNFNADSDLTASTWKFSITPANQNAPTGLGVEAPTASGGNGKITGTTDKMEYSTDSSFTSPTGTTCTDTATAVPSGIYYVRFKADSNHHAGATATVTVPAYSATKYTVTVTSDANGTADADKTASVAAGETVTLTATPSSGYVFDKWDNKIPAGLAIGAGGTFTMPSENVSVKATFKPAALTGTASITGTLKFGEELTATLTGGNNTGNLDYKWYQNGTTQVAANNTGKYTLTADDIGKTITVKITSNVQTGEITSAATAAVDKADGPAAPTAFTLTFTPNADGTTFTATIPAFAGGEYSFDGATYSTTNTKTDCAANTSYTGYARVKETATHKTGTEISDTQTSPKLTVATPTFAPNGVSSFTGMQSVIISCTTVGAKIYYTTDGTPPTASSTEYTAALSLTSTTTVKAIAVKPGMNDSATATATFTKYSGGGGGGGSYTPSYTVSVDKTENGTITVSPKSASKGDAVTITVKPDKGYELEDLTVLDSKGKELALTEKNGKYSFKMPAGKVEVKATFIKEAEISPFDDVSTNAYYYEAVKWAQEKGITGGVGNGLFAPNQPCTRAQIVTFLWRAAGSPAPKNTGTAFGDVKPGSFYEQAVAWAVENGITGGTGDGKFSPDATCTRAQSVTFLYRAAGSPKVSSSAEFGDVATNAYYADAVAWAAKNGITGGIGGGLFGSGNDCTRGQIVTFLYRAYNK